MIKLIRNHKDSWKMRTKPDWESFEVSVNMSQKRNTESLDLDSSNRRQFRAIIHNVNMNSEASKASINYIDAVATYFG